jgi:hypothetical protein
MPQFLPKSLYLAGAFFIFLWNNSCEFLLLVQKGYDCHVQFCEFYPFITSSVLDDACEEDDVLKPFDGD